MASAAVGSTSVGGGAAAAPAMAAVASAYCAGGGAAAGLSRQASRASSSPGASTSVAPAGASAAAPATRAARPTTTGTVAVPVRTHVRKVHHIPLIPSSDGEVQTYPYHDPAFGCSFRANQPSKDVLDHRLLKLEPDQKPPLQVLHEWEKWAEVEDHRRHLWEYGYHEMHPPMPYRTIELPAAVPATVCRAPPEEHQGFAWFLAGCP